MHGVALRQTQTRLDSAIGDILYRMSNTPAYSPEFYSWAERTGYFSGAHHLWAFQSGAGYALVDDSGRLQTWNVDRREETLDDGAVRVFRTREAAVVWAADMCTMYGWRLSPVTMASPPESSPALNLWRVELPLYKYASRTYS